MRLLHGDAGAEVAMHDTGSDDETGDISAPKRRPSGARLAANNNSSAGLGANVKGNMSGNLDDDDDDDDDETPDEVSACGISIQSFLVGIVNRDVYLILRTEPTARMGLIYSTTTTMMMMMTTMTMMMLGTAETTTSIQTMTFDSNVTRQVTLIRGKRVY